MINSLGLSDTEESIAARAVEAMISDAWPWIVGSKTSSISLIPNVQCYGQKTRDLDLVVLADIADDDLPNAAFRAGLSSAAAAGLPKSATKVLVRSLCLVVEVKDQPEQFIRFDGGKVSVRYAREDKWHDASMQSEAQKYSLKGYLAQNKITPPRITNLIWLRNVETNALPKVTNNILPAALTWTTLCNTVMVNFNPRRESGNYVIDHESLGTQVPSIRACERVLAKRQEPTALDRRRVEAVCKGTLDQRLLEAVGHRMLLLSGRGGTGKTIVLLRLAYKQSQFGKRAIVLTYNQALKSDLERLLVLTGIRDDIAAGTVQVYTVQSFILKLLRPLGILGAGVPEDFLEEYENYLDQALDYIQKGAITGDDLSGLVAASPEEFDWNLILLDEAQDWPDSERDFIRAIYPPSDFVVADGRDQLIRRNRNCDWKAGLRKDQYEVIQCERSFRLKRNLAHFANRMAAELGLAHWEVDENNDLPGGRVIIIEGDYFSNPDLHRSLVESSAELGNMPVDMLACVPPHEIVDERDICAEKTEKFNKLGQPIWNGTDQQLRRIPPTAANELRLVHYESCRGLEGWVTINFGFDRFYSQKKNLARKLGPEDADRISDPELWTTRFAGTWAMIPLTRAIDTLVIEVSKGDSEVKSILRKINQGGAADFIIWMTT